MTWVDARFVIPSVSEEPGWEGKFEICFPSPPRSLATLGMTR